MKDKHDTHKAFQEILSENQMLKDRIKELEYRILTNDKLINKLAVQANLLVHSVRYRLGDTLIKALKPSIDTIKLPIRLMKLFYESYIRKNHLSNKPSETCYSELGIANSSVIQNKEIDRVNKYLADYARNDINCYEKDSKKKAYKLTIIISFYDDNENLATLLSSIHKNMLDLSFKISLDIVIICDVKQYIDNIIDLYKEWYIIKPMLKHEEVSLNDVYNKLAKQSEAEYLMFIDSNIDILNGCINNLFEVALCDERVGVISPLVVNYQLATIQHGGFHFKWDKKGIHSEDQLKGKLITDDTKLIKKVPAIKRHMFLIQKDKFLQVDGFSSKFSSEYVDIDLCLKLYKKGYFNCIVENVLVHYHEAKIKKDQTENIPISKELKSFQSKWSLWLERQYKLELLSEKRLFFNKPLKVAFAVTEAKEQTTAGDYFTAMEFGAAMKKRGWDIEFLEEKGKKSWYIVKSDIDILINLLPSYDVRKVQCHNKGLITVAWARNWFESWVRQPHIRYFTYILASSEIACNYMERILNKKVHLLKIATNKERFFYNNCSNDKFKCDFCFTGSYWNEKREIIDMLDPQDYPEYDLNIYGDNWEKNVKFKNNYKGFINYDKMPEIYASTKIVIDDANRVTKPFGSVNSRVFDALASGALVITNGDIGSEFTFDGLLPVYSDAHQLKALITYYLSNNTKRSHLVKQLQDLVLEKHTYDKRVDEFISILGEIIPKKSIIIKTPVPNRKIAKEWGDYYFAKAMVKEFTRLGHEAKLQFLNEWQDDDTYADVVIVLRGLSKYIPKSYHYNIMWNISHPNKIDIDEYYAYDMVYIASEYWTNYIKSFKKNNYTEIEVLLQCTDPEVFKPLGNNDFIYELLFVGNSRGVFRKIIKDILPTHYDLTIIGSKWKGVVPAHYIKGVSIPNEELYKCYSSAKIVLNDHWEDMREKGFISNRVFDALACKAFIITDEIPEIEKYFEGSVISYKDKEDLNTKISYYLSCADRRNIIEEGYNIVINNHTFFHRLKVINDRITYYSNIIKEEHNA